MNQEKFGQFINELRKEKGLTQKELGDILHISDKAISKWERGASCPDIEMLTNLADILDVSMLELIQGKRQEEDKLDKLQVEEVLTDTVDQVVKQKKRTRKRFNISIIIIICTYLLILLLRWGINYALDAWTDKNETPFHRAEYALAGNSVASAGYYVYREKVDDFLWDYHVVGVDASGEEGEIFTIQQSGMDLRRAPKLIRRGDVLYLLFEGIDNEDLIERLYNGVIGADPQGFLPCLYKYSLHDRSIERIDLDKSNQIMLMDAFPMNNHDYYLAQNFKGVLWNLHLGFYIGDKTISSIKGGTSYKNLFGDGGLKSTGYADNNGKYYVAGLKGIYEIDLRSGRGMYIKDINLSHCYRSEINRVVLNNGKEGYAVSLAIIDTVNTFNEPKTMHTDFILYDSDWKEISKIKVPTEISSIEWGKSSAMMVDREGNCYYVDFVKESFEQLDVTCTRIADEIQLDYMDEAKEQWVYLADEKKYFFTGDGSWYLEK